jgi:hypothetical protein
MTRFPARRRKPPKPLLEIRNFCRRAPVNDCPARQAKAPKALTPLLEIRNLTKSFDGQHAVDDVSLYL